MGRRRDELIWALEECVTSNDLLQQNFTSIDKLAACRQVGLHVVHEEGVVRPGGDDADLDAVLGVPVEELVVHEHLVQGVEVVHGPLPVGQERVLVHLDVGRAPAMRCDHQGVSSEAEAHR